MQGKCDRGLTSRCNSICVTLEINSCSFRRAGLLFSSNPFQQVSHYGNEHLKQGLGFPGKQILNLGACGINDTTMGKTAKNWEPSEKKNRCGSVAIPRWVETDVEATRIFYTSACSTQQRILITHTLSEFVGPKARFLSGTHVQI